MAIAEAFFSRSFSPWGGGGGPRRIWAGALAAVLLPAAVLFAPSSARAAGFEYTGGNAHIAALVAGPNPQITSPVPASLSASELTALCATLLTEAPLAPATIASAHRAILDNDLNYDIGSNAYACGSNSFITTEAPSNSVPLALPALIAFSFSPAAPAAGTEVTATATYTDLNGGNRSAWSWTITDSGGNAVTDTEAAGVATGLSHSTTFTMPSGDVTVAHSMASANGDFIPTSTASRTTTLSPAATAPATPAPAPRVAITRTVTATEGDAVTLTASVTRPSGDTTSTLAYAWAQLSDASRAATVVTAGAISLTNASGAVRAGGDASATFTAPSVAATDVYHFRLSATAARNGVDGGVTTELVTVIVQDSAGIATPVAPTVTVPAAFTVDEGATVTITGGVTHGAGDTTSRLTYQWDHNVGRFAARPWLFVPDGNTATPVGTGGAAVATFTAASVAADTDYSLRLQGVARRPDGSGQVIARQNVVVTVRNLPDNPAPVANAGADFTASVGETVTLSGRASRGAGDTASALTYRWEQIPNAIAIRPLLASSNSYAGGIHNAVGSISGGSGDAIATFTAPATLPAAPNNVAFFRLIVTATADGVAASHHFDRVRVTVNPPPVPAPTVTAASTSGDESRSITVSGTVQRGAGDTNSALTYEWAQVTAADGATETDAADALTLSDASGSVAGDGAANFSFTAPAVTAATDYFFRLTATAAISGRDSGAATAVATVTVNNLLDLPALTVTPGADITADEGALDADGALTTLAVHNLSASHAIADSNAAAAYQWRQVNGADPAASGYGPTGSVTINGDTTAAASFSFDSPGRSTLFFEVAVTATRSGYNDLVERAVVTATIRDVEPPVVSSEIGLFDQFDSPQGTAPPPGAYSGPWRLRIPNPGDPDGAAGLAGLQRAWSVDISANDTPPTLASLTARGFSPTAANQNINFDFTSAPNRYVHYVFTVTFTDGGGNTASDSITVTIRRFQNDTRPNAGPAQTVDVGTLVTLDGTASVNSGGQNNDDLTYFWVQTADASSTAALATTHGDYVQLSDSSVAQPTFTAPPTVTTLHFYLTVQDSITQHPINASIRNSRTTVTTQLAGRAATVTRVDAAGNAIAVPEEIDEGQRLRFKFTIDGGGARTAAIAIGGSFGTTAAGDDDDADLTDFCTTDSTSGAIAALSELSFTGSIPTTASELIVDGPWICADGTAEAAEPFTVAFTASGDDITEASTTLGTITINPPPAPAPTVSVGTLAAVNEGAEVTLTGTVTAAAGDTTSAITYAWAQVTDATGATAVGDGGIAVDPASGAPGANGAISGTFTAPQVSAAGDIFFRLTGTAARAGFPDGVATAVVTVSINDLPVPVPPVITGASDQTLNEGDLLTVTANIAHGEGDGGSQLRWAIQHVQNALGAPFGGGFFNPNRLFLTGFSNVPEDGNIVFNFIPPSLTTDTTYYVQLRAEARLSVPGSRDLTELSAHVVRIDYTALPDSPLPTANAGADQSGIAAAATITLSGTITRDSADTTSTVTYLWEQVNNNSQFAQPISTTFNQYAGAITGAAGTLAADATATATVTAPSLTSASTLYFRLTAIAKQPGNSRVRHSDIVNVGVNATTAVTPRSITATRVNAAGATIAANAAVSEGDRLRFKFDIADGGPRSEAVVVSGTIAATSATGDDDAEFADFCTTDATTAATAFSDLNFSATIATGASTASVDGPYICSGDAGEVAEAFTVALSVSGDGLSSVGGGIGDITINEQRAAQPTMTPHSTATRDEGASHAIGGNVDGIPAGSIAWTITQVESADSASAATDNLATLPETSSGTLTNSGGNIDISVTLPMVDADATLYFRIALTASRSGHLDNSNAYVQTVGVTNLPDATNRTFQVTVDNAAPSEGGTVNFSVGFAPGSDMPSGATVSVRWTIGGDVNAADYTAPASTTGVLTYTTLTAQTVAVTIGDDNTNEAAEALTITLSDAVGGDIGTASATATIAASDPISVAITATSASVGEAGTANYRVTLSGGSRSADVVVPFTFGGTLSNAEYSITAPGSIDPTATGGTLTFAAGDTSLESSITVNLIGDSLNEAAETLILTGTAPGPSGLRTAGSISFSDNTETLTITDDDEISVAITATSASVGEAATANYRVTLSGGSRSADVVVPFTFGGTLTNAEYSITAPGSIDPTATGGTLTFAAGDTSLESSITVNLIGDSLNEAAETLILTGTAPGPSGLRTAGSISFSDNTETLTITDDDEISVAITATSASVGEAATANYRVTLTGGDRTADVLVPFTFSGTLSNAEYSITAPSGIAATATGGTLTFAAGGANLESSITVNLIGDSLNEAAETLILTGAAPGMSGLRTAGSIRFSDNTETLTINDDDPITVTLADASDINEGSTATFAVRLSTTSSTATTVNYSVTSSGTPPAEFSDAGNTARGSATTDSSGVLTIAAGSMDGNIEVTATNSALVSTTRDLTVTLGALDTNGGGAISGSGAQTVRVTYLSNVDRSFAVAVNTDSGKTMDRDTTAPGIQVNEGDTVYFNVSLSGTAITADASVDWAPTAGHDTASSGATLTFTTANHATAQEVSVVAAADTINEGAEMLGVTLSNASIGTGSGSIGIATASAAVTVPANDALTYAIADAAAVTEGDTGGAAVTTTYTVTLSGATESAWTSITIPILVAGGSTAASSDYRLSASQLVFSGTTLSQDITLTVTADNLNEAAETVVLELGAAASTTGSGGGAISRHATNTRGSATINDDDAVNIALSRRGASGNLDEGQTASYRVTASGAELSGNLSVDIGITGAGITSGDYNLSASSVTISPATGMSTAHADFTLAAADDPDNEPMETMTVTISNAATTGSATITTASDTVAITESDPVSFTVARSGAAAADEGGTLSFTITRSPNMGGAGTVAFNITGNNLSDGDYNITTPGGIAASATGGTLNFAANQPSATITLSLLADSLNEAAEMLTLNGAALTFAGLTGPHSYAAGGDMASATINASDPLHVTLADASDINEGGTASFALTLSSASSTATTVNYSITTSGGTAPPFTDPGSGSITIAAGQTTGAIAITADGTGAIDSGSRNITVTVDSISSGNGGGPLAATPVLGSPQTVAVNYRGFDRNFAVTVNTASGKTTDRDTTAPGVQVNEGDTVYYSVAMTPGSSAPTSNATVMWTPSGDTTASGGATLTFTATNYMTAQEITLVAAQDDLNEGSEPLTVTLSGASGGGGLGSGIETASASVTVTDDDPIMVAITADAASAVESGTAAFTVTLSGGTRTANVVAPFSVSGLGAAEFAVTAPTGGSITFAAADTSVVTAAISVNLLGDSLNEASKTLTVMGGALTSAGAVNYTSGGSSASVTVTDDDTLHAHLSGPTAVSEGGAATFTVTLRTGTGASDPVGMSAGAFCVPFSVVVNNQQTPANDATRGADIALVAPNNATCAARSTPVTPNAATGAATASVQIPARTASVTFDIQTRFDSIDEGATGETLTVSLLSSGGTQDSAAGVIQIAGAHTTASTTINNINAARSLAIAPPAAAVDEGGALEFAVRISGAPVSTAFNVNWSVTTGSADVTPISGTLNFAVGATMQTITLTATDDAVNEADETITVTLSDPCPAPPAVCAVGGRPGGLPASAPALRLTTASANGTINESDHPVTLSVDAPSGALTEGTAANFTVSFAESVTTTAAVTATWTLSFPGAGAASAADFATLTGTATIPAGQSSVDIPITAAADNLNEAAESFTFTLSNPAGGGAIAAPMLPNPNPGTTATIAASDPITASIAADAAAVNEGAAAAFTVTLSGATAGSAADITATYTLNTIRVTPTDANGGSITIRAGATEGAIVLGIPFSQTLGSSTPDDMLTVTLNTVTAASGGGTVAAAASPGDSATVTVNYIDAAHTLTFSSPALAITEGDSATYTVSRSGPSIAGGASIAVRWTYSVGTAAAADFAGGAAPAGGTLTFTGNGMSQTFTIATAQDTASEPGETFTLGLTAENSVLSANGGVALPGNITVTIGENDRPVTLSVDAPSGALTEGTAANFTVSFAESVTTTAAVTATWTLGFPGAGTASAADFATLTGAATIPAGQSSVDIAITATADAVNEAAETFTFTLSNPAGGGAIAAPMLPNPNPGATATIAASDPITASIAADAAAVNEGGSAAFTVTLSGATAGSAADITATYTLNTISVTPTDTNSGSITIRAGATTGAIVLGIPFSQTLGSSTPDDMLTVTLDTVTAASGGGTVAAAASPGNSATVTVNYIDAAHTLTFSSPALAITEGDSATYTVRRSGPAIDGGASIAVRWTYIAGSADAADFAGGVAPAGGILTFTGSVASQTFTIATAQDTASEPGETFTLGLMAESSALSANGGVALPGRITVTIGESDRLVTLAVDTPSGALTEGTAANFTVSFAESVTTTAAVTATWTLSFTGGTASAADFASLTGAATIAAGQSSVDIPITATTDNRNEAAETFTFTLSNPAGGGAIAAPMLPNPNPGATATIAASDPITARITRSSVQTAPVNEGSNVQFTVALALTSSSTTPATSAAPICVTFDTAMTQSTTLAAGSSPNTAQNPDIAVNNCSGAAVTVMADGRSTGGGITIPAGQSSATLAIAARFDNEDEGSNNETLTVTLRGATHTGLTSAAALTADPAAATAMIANVNALRTLAVSAASVTGGTEDETADGADRTDSGMASVDFTVGITGMALTEAVEVEWTLVVGDDGAILPGGASASGLARNNHDDPDFGAATIMVRNPDGRTMPGGGTVNANGISGTLSFPVDAPTARTISVPVLQDALNEGAEGLTLRLTDPCPPSPAVCSQGGGGGGATPALQLATAEQRAEVPASDPIVLSVRRVETGTLVSGGAITFVASFGTTTVNGVETPIAPSRPITITLPLMGADDPNEMVTLTAAAGATEATHMPIAKDDIVASGRPMITVGTPSITVTGTADAPPGGASVPAPTDTARLPAPVQTATWSLARTLPGGAEAPEGADYRVVFRLEGSATPTALSFTWHVAGSAPPGGGDAAVVGDFNCAAAGETPRACTQADGFPSGRLSFTAGDSTQTIRIAIFDDGQNEGMQPGGAALPEGFTLTLDALSGADAGNVEFADADSRLPGTLQVDIPALRADLRIADATAAEGGRAVFPLTLSGFRGGERTTQPVTVSYRVGVDASGAALFPATDSAERGENRDYDSPATGTATIMAGAASEMIEIPLRLDGVLEPRETFTLTITDATGGGGSIRLVNAAGEEQPQITATGTITDDADQAARRRERVGILFSVLDRQTAVMATDAITARLEQSRAAGGTQLSIANRNLLGGGAGTAQSANDSNLGLALYGAAGLGGATAGLPGGGGSGGASAASAGGGGAGGGNYTGGNAFAGLGAGLAGGANMGQRTALPSLAELLNGSHFNFQATAWPDRGGVLGKLASNVGIWVSGAAADLSGNPRPSGNRLDYDGDSIGAFIGADSALHENLLVGLALGWSSSDLDFTDHAGDFTMRGKLTSDTLSLHPYLGWQITPNINSWLMLGFGSGSVDVEESEGSGDDAISRALDGADSSMRMISAGVAGRKMLSAATDLKLRLALTRVQSRVDSGRFDDGALLPSGRFAPGALLPKARGRSLRAAGEAEVGHRFSFANGASLRPFGALRLRLDNTSTRSSSAESDIESEAFDVGAGLAAAWPQIGLDGGFAISVQLSDTGHEEHRASVNLNYDFGADSEGLTMAVQTAITEKRGGLLNATAGLSGLGGGGSSLGGALSGGLGKMERSIKGEFGYGVAFRQFGRAGLLTPYGRFDLGQSGQRWAAGLRLAESGGGGLQIGVEAGLDLEAGRAAAHGRSYDLLLTGRLRFQ